MQIHHFEHTSTQYDYRQMQFYKGLGEIWIHNLNSKLSPYL